MHRLPLFAAALLLVGAAAEPAAPAPAPAPASAKTSVGVLYYDHLSNNEELKILRKGLAQMLITDLISAGGFTVVERERLQDVLDELKLQRSAKIDQGTACKIGKMVGARYLVVGSYVEMGGTMILNSRVLDTEKAVGIHSLKVQGKADDFADLEQKVANDFAPFLAKLVPPAPAPAPGSKTGANTPASDPAGRPKAAPQKLAVQTVVKYSKALDALDRKDKEAAKKELEAVVKEQPDFKLAASELAALML